MPKAPVSVILESRVSLPNEDKVEIFGKACGGPQSGVRRELSDTSNLPEKPRPVIKDENSKYDSTTAKEYIEQLQKENNVLVKMLAQRNKILERSGLVLERTKIDLIKFQLQNQQLAHSRTQMLVELNSGKDKLKALNHELGIKSALLSLKEMELKVCVSRNSTKFHEGKCAIERREDEKMHTAKRTLRSHSLNPSRPVKPEDNAANKRPLKRRQSARFSAAELKTSEESPEMVDDAKSTKCPLPDNPTHEDTSANASTKIKQSNADSESSQESRRSSMSRPSRLATKKVQSYKEVPLNIKMRRAE